jgi:perosamine synthetase
VIRLTIPSIEDDDLRAVCDVLATGYLVQGDAVAAFEQAVAACTGRRHAVAVSSCTAALHLSLLAAGVRPGHLVVVTAYSWVATANVIELCGAQPVFVDIEPHTFNLDPAPLADTLERLAADADTAARVKAILPVHTFGQVADMPAIMELAERHGVPVIEDAACALGATRDGRQAGTWGLAGCFSFHPRKAITTGEGGMVVTDDDALARRLRALRNHGLDTEADPREFIAPGFNYRMTDFQGALGRTQMAKLDRVIVARRRLAARYDELLADTPVQAPAVAPDSQPVYQSYVVLLPKGAARRRDQIIAALGKQDIQTTIGTIHIPMAAYYRKTYGYRQGDFPVTDDVFARSLTLPLHERLTPSEQEQVVRTLVGLLDPKQG